MGIKPWSDTESVLYDLCIRHGYCLPPEKVKEILDDPPSDTESFADAVLTAEGLRPEDLRTSERRMLNELVAQRLFPT